MMVIFIKFWRECIIALLAIFIIILLAVQNHTAGKLKDAESKCKAEIAAIEQAQQKALIEKQNKINKVSADYEQQRAEQQIKTELVYRTIEKVVEKPVYLNNCFDDDGRLQLNSLIKSGYSE